MAAKTIAVRGNKGKREIRGELTKHEIALIAELYALYGWRGAARRLAR